MKTWKKKIISGDIFIGSGSCLSMGKIICGIMYVFLYVHMYVYIMQYVCVYVWCMCVCMYVCLSMYLYGEGGMF
jgi:hypothetical protein